MHYGTATSGEDH
jgi:hypothetical protein